MKEAKFFKTYYKTIQVTAIVILVAAISLASLQFYRGLEHEFTLIKEQFRKGNADLELTIEACVEHVRAMRIRSEDFLTMPNLEGEQPLFNYLSNNSAENYYHLDNLPDINSPVDFTGNLTGKGSVDSLSEEKRRELNMALSLNHLFKATARNIPNVAWVYYVSEDFINMYPHVPSSEFHYNSELFYHDFYQNALPTNNPRGEMFWTTAYIDEAGKGLMVSCADPVYENGVFKGSVVIDLTLDSLHRIINNSQRSYGQMFIINPSEQILAHPSISAKDTKITLLTDVIPQEVYQQIGDFSGWDDAVPHRIAGHYVYFESVPDTSWKMVYVVGVWETYLRVFAEIGLALLFLFFAIGFVLVVANRTISAQFIRPTQKLMEHIQMENSNLPSAADANIPDAWRDWFRIITRIFRENRDLVYELEREKQSLEHSVDIRTSELMETNEELRASEEELKTMNEQLTGANEEISLSNKKITDSINYARRIQKGIMPQYEGLQRLFTESFCLFMPRDIVSGDFYWFGQENNLKIIAVADCTGHGVPGAFMSMLGITALEDVIKDRRILSPEKVLESMRVRMLSVFQKRGNSTPKDGLNISLCVIDEHAKTVSFAGAYHPLLIVRQKSSSLIDIDGIEKEVDMETATHQLFQLKSDKQPIGHFGGKESPFTQQTFHYSPTDRLYLYSDGYIDQFGGPEGRKFMSKRFKSMILNAQNQESLEAQRKVFKLTLKEWMGKEEQIDDICVMGVELI